MGFNMTLLLNIGAVGCAGAATSLVHQFPLMSLGLSFLAGLAITISSKYAIYIAPDGEQLDGEESQ
jgi:hypothetical protein